MTRLYDDSYGDREVTVQVVSELSDCCQAYVSVDPPFTGFDLDDADDIPTAQLAEVALVKAKEHIEIHEGMKPRTAKLLAWLGQIIDYLKIEREGKEKEL